MKPQYREYLESIGVTSTTLVSAVENALGLVAALGVFEFDALFINDHVDEKGVRQYGDLELISHTHVAAVRAWNTAEPKKVMIRDFSGVTGIELDVKNFDFATAQPESRLSVSMDINLLGAWSYKASQNNCLHLLEIVRSYLWPSLFPKASAPADLQNRGSSEVEH